VTLRLLHTADWQIGKPFGRIGGEAGAELFLQRIRTVERIALLARERAVDAVLVAGDAFDSNEVSTRTLDRAIAALKPFEGPWIFLPGNHDPALAHSVWTRLRRMGLPDNVVIADEPRPLSPWRAAATLLPAPLRRRREAADQTAWFDAAATPEGHLRIGLAHGGVADRLPTAAEAANEIPPERAEQAGLAYLALGDWHGVIEIAPRTWYSGTPEPDRHRDNRPGHVNLVDLAGPGAPPAVEPVAVGHFHWASLTVAIEGGSADAAIAAVEALAENCRRCVLSLTLTGVIGLAERARLAEAVARWRDQFHVLDLEDRLRDEPTADDLDAIDRGGFVRVAVDRLAAIAGDPGHPDAAAARTALRMLYLDHVNGSA
jgi:DNA repair exonuclease SbcCD nuclease subunit